ncbi:RNA dependent RNA polymerase RdRp [Pterostylis amalgavirus 2]|nr:RNA dependent RNA polymerase RdRp [Pterostylis amalgavirus 2]
MAGPSAPVRTLGVTPDEEMETNLRNLLEPLRAMGLRPEVFSLKALHAQGITYDAFCKLSKVLLNYKEEAILDALITAAIRDRAANSFRAMTVTTFISFCKWLKSPLGQKGVQAIFRERKLTSKAPSTVAPTQVTYTTVLGIMIQDYSTTVKEERAKRDERITRYRRKIRGLEIRKEERLAELRAEWSVADGFREPDFDEINREAFKKYEAEAKDKGLAALPLGEVSLKIARDSHGQTVRWEKMEEYCRAPQVQAGVHEYLEKKILFFDSVHDVRQANTFVPTWLQSCQEQLWRLPLPQRILLARLTPVGQIRAPGMTPEALPLERYLPAPLLEERTQQGVRVKPLPLKLAELQEPLSSSSLQNPRLRILISFAAERGRAIPVARSHFEASLRRIIGGGEMRDWSIASSMFRGGGNSNDALRLLSQADWRPPGKTLREVWSVDGARRQLGLDSGLAVPDGIGSVRMKNFNEDATAGPFLRAFGVKKKFGLKGLLENFMWRVYDSFALGRISQSGLPFLTARVGFRTKLVPMSKALEKISEGDALGRAVMMLDALEQASSSPLYNVLSNLSFRRRHDIPSGFCNGIVRASSDWGVLWEQVKRAQVIVELDWKKFDRERPSEDLLFLIEVVVSCFLPRSPREERLLLGYKIMMQRALVERSFVMDEGGAFSIEGMVPSGSLWTGWVDTALNILYIKAACFDIGIAPSTFVPKCAGDDNLTLFSFDPGDARLLLLRKGLNEWFRAGIEEEDFLILRPPFHVSKFQAVFPPGTDLARGTSKILEKASWVEFEGEPEIDPSSGKSHRWEYRFKGKPKFLASYWLQDGRPIRPAADNLEKLLWPEGIHSSLEEYEASVASMIVDNPWNHHNLNHLLSRYVIIQEIRRVCSPHGNHHFCMSMAKEREKKGAPVPFPSVAPWRRGSIHGRLEDYPEAQQAIRIFREFAAGVTSLYARKASGGIDAWKFMDILRGDSGLGKGQFGNDIIEWVSWLRTNPMTRLTRATKSYRELPIGEDPPEEPDARAVRAFDLLGDILFDRGFESQEGFSTWLSNLIRNHAFNS